MRRLTRTDLRRLSTSDTASRLNAQEWWLDNAPAGMAHLYDALYISSPDKFPTSDLEFDEFLLLEYPGTNNSAWRTRMRILWATGAIYFFFRGRFYTKTRTPVSPMSVRGALDRAIAYSRTSMMADCAALRDGSISLSVWEERMVSWIKSSIIAGAVISAGGIANMSDSRWAIVDRNIEAQMGYLHEFAGNIASGAQPMNGNICRIMFMYLQSGRGTYHDIEAARFSDAGFDEYASVRTSNESCAGCIEEEQRGFVPLGDLVPIGSRDCLTHCLCYYIYRKSTTGEIDDRR